MPDTKSNPELQLSAELEQCYKILKEIQKKDEAYAFLEPVDWKELNIPDYPQIITNPMDLVTIETKLHSNQYANAYDFAKDMRLVWSNAKEYNKPGSGIFTVAVQLGKFWERRFAKIKKSSTEVELKGEVVEKLKARKSSREDQLRFTELIKGLDSKQLGYIVETVEKKCPNAIHEDMQDEVEIEVYLIDATTLQELINYATTNAK